MTDSQTYFESARGVKITRERALEEIRSHGCSVEDFDSEKKIRKVYSAQAVLSWLGY
jgi:hypothetical protein